MDLSVLTATFAEPVTVSEMTDLMGYPGTDQDANIAKMIKVAREWLENRTGLSVISKSYKAYFDREDAIDGWYELPISPVLSIPAITVSICGTSMTFVQKGLNKVRVKPDGYYATIGTSGEVYYVEVIFQAGKANETANECIRRIVTSMFNNREDGGNVSTGRLPFDTLRLIETIDQNTGL